MRWLLTKYDKVYTKKWWKPHNPKSYQKVYFNENLQQYRCKISCSQSFWLKSTQTRGFSIMWWLLTKYDKIHDTKCQKPHNPICYQNVYFNELLQQYKLKISCFQKFWLKSTQTRGLSIMCWLWPNMTKYMIQSGENPITQCAIKIFTSMNFCNNINVRFHVFKNID